MSYETILFDVDADGVATLTLNRPEKRNAWNRQMGLEIRTALKDADARDDVRVVIVTGAGKVFDQVRDGEAAGQQRLSLKAWDVRKPIIGALNGAVAGVGATLPLHWDIAWFAGWKVVMIVLWLPIAFGLSLVFDPTLSPRPAEIVTFAIAIWGAYLIRTMLQESLGMLCFWTTRGAAIFDLYMTVELLLSGRLVPLPLMPDWVQEVSRFLPFQWAFYFPIESLVGDLSNQELVQGLFVQLFWILVGLAIFRVAWRSAIKRYSAVGG